MNNNVLIYDTLRTARGGGKKTSKLYEVKPIRLLEIVMRALQKRHFFNASQIDDAIIGCVSPIKDQGFNIARAALLEADMAECRGGMQINRYCTSGLEAINLAAAKITAGWENLIIAGGTESMSRVPLGSDGGPLINDPGVLMPHNYIPQGIAADLIASKEGFSRLELDEYALQSQQRASKAQQEGYFSDAIIPICDAMGLPILIEDELIRHQVSIEKLSQLKPAFTKMGEQGFASMALHPFPEVERINYVHTAGNSSQLSDGAALALIGNKAIGKTLGLKPRAKFIATASASVHPTIMLTGPSIASQLALKKAGLTVDDIDIWECNEAFASVVLKFQRDLNIPNDKLNVNGGAIAMGHPLGATGAMLLGTALDELERTNKTYALITLCGGAGLATATIIQRMSAKN